MTVAATAPARHAPTADQARRPSPCRGHIAIAADGKLEGWCWYPDAPTERAIVDILVNGETALSIKATLSRGDLRELGMGDGFNGFAIALPREAGQAGAVIEARERRLRQVFGRIVVGTRSVERETLQRLARIDASLDASLGRAGATWASLGPALGDLGRLLLAAGRRSRVDAQGAPSAIAAAMDHLAAVPATDLGFSATPEIGLVLTSTAPAIELAAAVRHAHTCLAGVPAEFTLIDDGRDPLAALLPTRLRHLRLLRVDRAEGQGARWNRAVLASRARWIAIVGDPRRLNGFAMAAALTAADPRTAYFGTAVLDLLGVAAAGTPTIVQRMPSASGLLCLLPRQTLLDAGGFAESRAAGVAAMWVELVEKVHALGFGTVGWREPRSFPDLASDGMQR